MKKTFKFQFSSKGERDFNSLDRNLQNRILNKIRFFEESGNPLAFAKQLQGLDNEFSFRIGDYRLIVSPEDENVLVVLIVLKIGHRREIYNS